MAILLEDLRYSARMLSKNLGITSAAVVILALGIGASTAIFSVVDAVLLRPLPFKDAERIVMLWESNPKTQTGATVSPSNYLDWKDQAQSFEQTAGWQFVYFNLTGKDQPERVQGLLVSAGFFQVLGINAAHGRTFAPEDDQPGQDKVVCMSYSLWQRRFGSDPSVIGQKIIVEGEPFTVVGVLPPEFRMFRVLNRDLDLYKPLALDRAQLSRGDRSIFVYARLKNEVTLGQAQAEMDLIYRRLDEQYPDANSGWTAQANTMPGQWVKRFRPTLISLLAAAGFLLLIVCANVANLMLVRATTRHKEIAIRVALGAAPRRIVGQLLTESTLLAFVGGAGGMLLAAWGVKLLNDFVPYTAINRMDTFRLDASVLCFTVGVSLLSGIAFGLAPALQSSKPNLNEALKEGSKGSRSSFRGRRLLSALVIAEVALAMVLLVGAGLMVKSALRLQNMDRGLDIKNVLTMQVWLPKSRYSEGRDIAGFYKQVLQRIEALPGVESASAINFAPLALQYTAFNFTLDGQSYRNQQEMPESRMAVVTPDYFRTMNILLLEGREFNEHDNDERRGAVIISDNAARRLWPGEAPLGKRITPQIPKVKNFWLMESDGIPLTVVGVVGNVNNEGLVESDLPQMYLPCAQNPSSIMNLLVRTTGEPTNMTEAVRHEVYRADKDQPVFDVKTMEEVLAESFSELRIFSSLITIFATLALLLAAVGVYGVISYSVTERTHEIGIRMALGAQRKNIVKMILGQCLTLVVIGVAIGVAGAFLATRVLSTMLAGVVAVEPSTFVGVALVLILVANIACLIPARRATKVEPMIALRHE